MAKKERIGTVVSNKADKTIVVSVQMRYQHPKYGKTLIKSKKYPFINRAVNAKTKPTPNNETMRTSTTDKEIYPTVQMKNNKRQSIKKGAYNRAKERGNVAPIDKSVSPSDLSKGLSNLVGKIRKLSMTIQ